MQMMITNHDMPMKLRLTGGYVCAKTPSLAFSKLFWGFNLGSVLLRGSTPISKSLGAIVRAPEPRWRNKARHRHLSSTSLHFLSLFNQSPRPLVAPA